MNDSIKTVIFVAVALAVLLVAWISQPRLADRGPEEMVGQPLVPDFDPLSAWSLEIVKYDEGKSEVRSFKVAHAKGVWSIPSHDDYPADAKEHLAEAAAGLLGRKILSVASQDPGELATFGVLDPNPKDPKKGMGTRVTLRDKDDKVLLDLVLGNEVEGKSELRYVRRAGQDPVYTAAIKTDRLSTKFEDWIEKNLLKISSFDIKQIDIADYSVDIVNEAINQRGMMTLEYNDAGDPRWKLARDDVFTDDGPKPAQMAPDEELNTAKLDDMKFALDDLKIVDVRPKPKGLSADLKAEESFMKDRRAVADLAAHGFFPAQVGRQLQLVSNEGEFRVVMKDGVEYLLRFGLMAGKGSSDEPAAKDKPEGKDKPESEKKDGDKDEKQGGGTNRFILVMAQFDESALPKPDLEKMPEEKPAAKPDATKPDAAKPDPSKPETSKPDAAKPDPAEPEAKPLETKPEEKKDLEAERKRIETENRRKLDEYNEKVENGKKKAKELNARFADWYYIIPDDVYRKIHLGRSDIIKKKEPPKKEGEKPDDHGDHDHPEKPGDTPADFEELKEKVPPPKETPAPAPPATPETKPAETPPGPKPAESSPKPAEPDPKPSAEPKPPAPKGP